MLDTMTVPLSKNGNAVHAPTDLGRNEVLEMLDEVRIARILRGFRNRPPGDREKLADLILAVAACALAHPEIELLETNPVFVYEDRAVAMDACAFLQDLTKSVDAGRPVQAQARVKSG